MPPRLKTRSLQFVQARVWPTVVLTPLLRTISRVDIWMRIRSNW